jgi:hypothetical protein
LLDATRAVEDENDAAGFAALDTGCVAEDEVAARQRGHFPATFHALQAGHFR